ncbi:MAG: hypothetical protein AAFY26_17220 [Cyanobacteria bacterium J06638_22]
MSIRRSQRKLQWFATIACTALLVLLSNLLSHPVPRLLSSQSAPGSTASIQTSIQPQLEPHPIVATFSSLLVAPANAQAVNVRDLAPLLYEALPYIPLENDYQDLEGDPAPQSTLLSRFVRYHTFTQQRSPLFRLDWKLTLADYLGQNETMFRDSYPNHNTLTENPFERDIEAIRALTRAQREELVNTLVDLLNPRGSQPASATIEALPATPPSQQRPAAGTGSPVPQEPRPGDAELLLQ